jgi:hypothetical protein
MDDGQIGNTVHIGLVFTNRQLFLLQKIWFEECLEKLFELVISQNLQGYKKGRKYSKAFPLQCAKPAKSPAKFFLLCYFIQNSYYLNNENLL